MMFSPALAGSFETFVNDVYVAALDTARTDGITLSSEMEIVNHFLTPG